MNLLDKLRAMDGGGAKPRKAAETVFTDCWHKRILRPIGEFPGALALRTDVLPLMCATELPAEIDPCRILYLDTETTGLGTGAGTVAFEVGLGYLTPEGFEIHQLVMRDYPEERFLLEKTAALLSRFDVLCTFNGVTFDVPLLRTRFLMNRMDAACLSKPHIDLLHIARRVYKLRLRHCNLTHLEEEVLGIPRIDDLPGSEAPQRYFNYLKNHDFGEIAPVLAHNEQDIASLCVLLTHMAGLYAAPQQVRHAEDLYAMGVSLERMRHPEEARRCYHLVPAGRLHASGQLRLAASWRRAGSRGAAKEIWLNMIAHREGGTAPYIELAKHYEHVERDIPAALEMTRQAMMLCAEPSLRDQPTVQNERNELQYRYERLRRKAQALKGRNVHGTDGQPEGTEGIPPAGQEPAR